jgi:type IV pilus assembly protein PilM
MKNRLFSKQTPIMVGIDMGAHSVKAVLLSRHNDVYKVDAIVVESMLKSVMADREIRDIKAMANVLSKIRKKIPRSVKFAATAVSGSTVISKIILMDVSLTDAELESQIEVEADTLIPYPLTEVSLDFEKLDVNEADPSKVNVLLSAARTESIEARVAALEQSGFTAKVVDIESYALSRAAQLCLKQLPDDAYEKVVAMIDIGATMTLLSIVQNGKTLYTRDQIFGGDQYTRSILSYYNKSYEEAEQAKINGDLPSDYTFEVLAPFQTLLLQQVRRGIQMYLTSSGKDRVDYLVLSGGTALITGMAQLISEELGIHTVLANPFNAMEVATAVSPAQLHCHASQLMVACGLALRSFSSWHI